jgi:hypothetical protein
VPGRGKNKRWARKRNDESQTVDLMPAWMRPRRCPGGFLLIQAHVPLKRRAKSPTFFFFFFTAANLPFEETQVAQRCEGVVKEEKRKAEGSGECRMGRTSACVQALKRTPRQRHAVFVRKIMTHTKQDHPSHPHSARAGNSPVCRQKKPPFDVPRPYAPPRGILFLPGR